MKNSLVLLPFLPLLALSTVHCLADRETAAEAQQSAEWKWKGRDSLVKFKGGIGVIPVASGVGTGATAEVVNRNIVRGVQPAGQIWVISALNADVKADGRIRVDGRGLLLGGGNAIGFNGNASVFATLICEAVAPFTELSTNAAGVPLDPSGDFRIDDVLVPAPPASCDSPVLLIRVTGANPAWFAAGIPKQD
jgi:hypothetical protein